MIKSLLTIPLYYKKSFNQIVILGRGPSINKSMDKIQSICDDNKVIFASNHNNDIFFVDFNVIIDSGIYKKLRRKKPDQNYIVGSKVLIKNDKRPRVFLLDYDFGAEKFYDIKISLNGKIEHMVGSCGNACIFSAILLGAKSIFLFGMDGTSHNFIDHYDKNSKLIKIDEYKINLVRNILEKVIIYGINTRNISFYCDGNCPLWGLDKKKLGIKLI